MKITLLQRDIVWGNPDINCKRAEEAILEAPLSDLYVLPEMWSTGFATEPKGIAEKEPSESLQWMHKMANRLNAAITGSIATQTKEGIYCNRLYFVKPQQTEEVFYDKHHLFSYGGENNHYTAGNERVVISWRGVRFLLQICYDLRFPVFARNHEDYDCIIYVASWPTSRIDAWNTLLHARALENQCYVIGVNRIGSDPACSYSGGTILIDAYGKDVVSCPMNQETSATAELDMNKLKGFRKKFPVLKDRD